MYIQVEYFTDRTVQKNSDLIRCILLMLDDVRLDTQRHAQHRNDIMGKIIIRKIWEPAEAENDLRIMEDFRREQVKSQTQKPNSHNPINTT